MQRARKHTVTWLTAHSLLFKVGEKQYYFSPSALQMKRIIARLPFSKLINSLKQASPFCVFVFLCCGELRFRFRCQGQSIFCLPPEARSCHQDCTTCTSQLVLALLCCNCIALSASFSLRFCSLRSFCRKRLQRPHFPCNSLLLVN